MTLPLLAGLGLGFSLIIAIGAQNLFVLRQGLRREHVLIVAALCAVSDAVLIGIGVSGIGLVLQALPWLVTAIRWTGAAFLIGYGLLAARRAWRPSGDALAVREEDASERDAPGRGAGTGGVATATRTRLLPVVVTTLALTWLNPHVYLDTVFLLGSVANTHGDGRWLFAAGAMAASVIWFFGLAMGARYLGRWLSTPASWRILDAGVAVVMIALGVSLVVPL
ncbi:LysE/ArgO family amino acid transporter [Microbacterium sp. ET2]|uniref:LysE/ArgO family amino acid transporter n=1 Tax=Microbacterium albipurpureum TaxID=3050384 RepID=UPI00259CAB07|nr:LysE/ArgO family amino acid transporter [Microbacterium sp. ET2 (Ac-2212)]WJL96324.1 LysE/ArgO family amino acid transporter [Microbacterium sp. ET2 (Ac-2212)]